MRREAPDASISLTILLIYAGIICVAAVVFLLLRWWRRFDDPLNFRRRSYSKRLAIRFARQRYRLRRRPSRTRGRRRR